MQYDVRALVPADLEPARRILTATGLFPAELLADMVAPFLAGADELWCVAGANDVSGLVYAAPERLTNGTWNALLLAVDPAHHDRGIGRALMVHLETTLATRARVLLVETSGTPALARTRGFYERIGYRRVATIPDFYDVGDDKVVFWRSLSEAAPAR